MKNIFYTTLLLFIALTNINLSLFAEDTGVRVYSILQTHCTNSGCHNNANAAAGLDLQGNGSNAMGQTYLNVYKVTPVNAVAQSKNNLLLYPGDPYRSYLFRLINNGLAGDVEVETAEDPDQIHRNINMSNVEKEFVRQWILYGAPTSGEIATHNYIEPFYGGAGVWSINPQNPPAKPDPSEGFQIHVGPIILPAWTNSSNQPDIEYATKYETLLPQALEINKIEAFLGDASHHFILYKFDNNNTANNQPYGFRPIEFNGVSMVSSYQGSAIDELPTGTAFKWQSNVVLNLNAHVLNYSTNAFIAVDIYANIYTQPDGTAPQEMHTALLPNPTIYIPGDGQEHTFETPFSYPINQAPIHIWKMSSHTHRHATDFDVWLRNPDGSKGEQIFDASHYNGIPTCEFIDYDYQHPPKRVFSPFLPLTLSEGIIQRASYVNCSGCDPLTWGETVDDEMMITGIFYVTSTNGIVLPNASLCYAEEILNTDLPTTANTQTQLSILPTAIGNETAQINISSTNTSTANLRIFDIKGQLVHTLPSQELAAQTPTSIDFDASQLPKGMYFAVLNTNSETKTAKFIKQ